MVRRAIKSAAPPPTRQTPYRPGGAGRSGGERPLGSSAERGRLGLLPVILECAAAGVFSLASMLAAGRVVGLHATGVRLRKRNSRTCDFARRAGRGIRGQHLCSSIMRLRVGFLDAL